MPNPVMSTFDAPSRDVCVVKRERTNTPLQALVLRHELGYVEAARAFAERLTEQESTLDAQLRKAWLLLLTRPPHASELDIVRTLYSEQARKPTASRGLPR